MAQKNIFQIYDGRTSFWQWDTGQKLIVLDNTIDQVHFSNKSMTYAIVKEVYVDETGVRVCDVPDVILKAAKPLIAYAYVMEDDQNKTICAVKYSVNSRQIPEDYTYEDVNRFKDLVDKIEYIEDMLESGASIKKFNNIEEAERWAKASNEVGLLISVNVDSKWTAYMVDSDHSIAKVCGNSNWVEHIDKLKELIGQVDDGKTVVQMIKDSVYDDTQIKKDIGANKQSIETLNGGADVEGSVDYKIAHAVAMIMENPDEAVNSINELIDLVRDSGIKPKITTITMLSNDWVGDDPYSQIVEVVGITANSKVDFQATADQIAILQDAGVSLIAENDNGVVKVWAIGGKLDEDMIVQVSITEVAFV